jgi:aerobic carbon-monoxide dehydrogenase large subunit
MLAGMVFRVPESQVRVIVRDVGGGFGAKGWQYVDHRLVLWAAKKLRRPVKWRCERSEALLADEHARDNVGTIELAFDDGGKILGLRLYMLANIGAYVGSDRQFLTPFGEIGTVVGVYDIPAAYVQIDGVLSNTSPTAPYRGAGRPEATYLIERALDAAAAELGIDPIELRRRNIIKPDAMPFKSPLGPVYDCGAFERIWTWHSLPPSTPDFRRDARPPRAAGNCAASGSPTQSSRRRGRCPNTPRSAFSRAEAPCR